MNHLQLGSCAVGIRTSEGIVLGVEKRLSSPLLEGSSVEKMYELDSGVGAAVSGLSADARTLLEGARVEAANHRFSYDEPLPVESLTQAICDIAMSFGEGGDENKAKMSRPFGVALLIGGVDRKGPCLFSCDPSGTYTSYDAHAIGNGSEGARTILQERYNKSLTLTAASVLLVRVLGEVMEEKLSHGNVELAHITPAKGWHRVGREQLDELIAKAQAEVAAEGGR
jgi:20S proteasome subunit alpha 5